MKPKRADKVLASTTPTSSADPSTAASDQASNSSSPYRAPRDARPQLAAERPARWQPKENILEVAAAAGRFGTLRQALDTAGLTSTLAQNGPFTLFAPTDEAFAKLPSADLRALLQDQARLVQLLSYHVVPSKVRAPRKQAPSSVTTLDGKQLEIAIVPEDGGYRIGEARLVRTNMRASNGVVHAVDTVLTPR